MTCRNVQGFRSITLAIMGSLAVGMIFSGASQAGNNAKAPAAHGKKAAIVNDPAFQKALLTVAAEYKSYGKVDDYARWAPWLCAAPPPPKPRLSSSGDAATHGRKVYFVYAKQRDQYFKKEAPKPGQVVVKESWYPRAAEASAGASGAAPEASDKQGDLFIMMKLKPDTPNTDNGWVYGTITADGKTVTSAGRNESCMGCHIPAPNDRLFGLAN